MSALPAGLRLVVSAGPTFEDIDPVRFVGNLTVGDGGVSVAELLGLYDAVILATGAPTDRPLGIPGEGLHGVMGSAAFVGWYNGHPDFADLAPIRHNCLHTFGDNLIPVLLVFSALVLRVFTLRPLSCLAAHRCAKRGHAAYDLDLFAVAHHR